MRLLLPVLTLVLATTQVAHAAEWVVEARYTDKAMLARAAARFQHVIVDAKHHTVRVATGDAGIHALEGAGLAVEIDQVASAKLQAFDEKLADAQARGRSLDSIPGFQCYRTVEETYQTMDDMVAAHPDIVSIDTIGPSWLKTQDPDTGYDMRALRITNLATLGSDPDRPKMVVFSSIHAREYAPAELDTRFAEWLVDNYGNDPEATWLVDHNDFRLVLQANPDGRKEAEQHLYWRKNVDDINGSCNFDSDSDGIDLNRNFPFHWNITHGQGSSGDTCDETYRGPDAISEPETENLVTYVDGICNAAGECTGGVFADRREGSMEPAGGDDDGNAAPDDTRGFFVDIHSNAALVLWPWGDTSTHAPEPNHTSFQTLGRRIAYFNGYTPEQSDSLYPTDGATDDNNYGLVGVPAFTIETNGTDFFEDCDTFENDTAPRNIAALRYVGRALHAPYLLPAGPDTVSVSSEPDLVVAGDPVTLTAHLDASRFNQSNGSEPVRDIASAAAYVDQLPWDAGASAQALAASDGAFDAPIEDAGAAIDTTGLASGRHLVYVQGTNVDGQAGTPDAAFIEVAQPDEIGHVDGTVTDALSGAPLAADLDFLREDDGSHHVTRSTADTGAYSENLRGGTFDLTVSADGYSDAHIDALDVAAGETLTRDVALTPVCTAIDDDAENGNQDWTVNGPWAIVPGFAGHPGNVWTDSPNGNYNDFISGDQVSLTSAAFDFSDDDQVSLRFDDYCDTESGYDYGHVDVSVNGGGSWNEVYSCSGRPEWQSHRILLPQLDSQASVRIRFRLTSDESVEESGWSLDDIRLEYGGDGCHQVDHDTIFASGFDTP